MVRFTGERLRPDDGDFRPDVSQHLAAYRACLRFVRGRDVLDGGCGEGYGTRCLAASARTVVGVDRSREAMGRALRDRPRNARFSCSELGSLSFSDGSFDVVCSLQVLEHFDRPAEFLREAVRVLRTPGLLLLTTPNRLTSFSENPYHVREYTPDELRELLGGFFASVEILGVFGNERVRALRRSRRRHVTRILRLDPLGLRRWLAPSVQKWAFAKLARVVRGRVRLDQTEAFDEVGPGDFTLRHDGIGESIDLFAVCRT